MELVVLLGRCHENGQKCLVFYLKWRRMISFKNFYQRVNLGMLTPQP